MKSKTEETSGLVPMSLITSALHSLPPSCKAPYFSCLHKSVTHPQTSAQIGLLFAGHDSTWLLPKFRCSIATTFWSSLSWSYSWATALEALWLMTCCEAHVMTQPVRPPFFKKLAPRLQVRRQQEVWSLECLWSTVDIQAMRADADSSAQMRLSGADFRLYCTICR